MPNKDYESDIFWMVNFFQTKDTRAAKYALCRSCGLNAGWARSMRDWRQITIDNFLQQRSDALQSKSEPFVGVT